MPHISKCVILANRHQGYMEGMRGLLESMFNTILMVADENSLRECAENLHPSAIVADLSLARSESLAWLKQLRAECPETKLVVLSVHDECSVCDEVMAAGADGFVVKRAITTDFMPGMEAVMHGDRYISPCVRGGRSPHRTHPETTADITETQSN